MILYQLKKSYDPYKHIESMKGFKIHDKDFKKSLNDIIRKLQYNQNDKTKFKSTMPVAVRNQEKLYDLIYKSINNNEEGARNKEYKNFVDDMKWFTTSGSYDFFKDYGLEIENINNIEKELDPINSIAIKNSKFLYSLFT